MTDSPNNFSLNDTGIYRRIFAWLLLPLSLFPLMALLTYDWRAIAALNTPPVRSTNWIGAIGDFFAYYGYTVFGLAIWIIPPLCVLIAILFVCCRRRVGRMRALWLFLLMATTSCLAQVCGNHTGFLVSAAERVNLPHPGGVIGYLIMTSLLSPLLSDFGAAVIVVIVMVMSVIAAVGVRNLAAALLGILKWAAPTRPDPVSAPACDYNSNPVPFSSATEPAPQPAAQPQSPFEAVFAARKAAKEAARAEKERIKAEKAAAKQAAKEAKIAAKPAPTPAAAPANEPTAEDKGPYLLPPVDQVLSPLKKSVADHSDVGEMSKRLIDTLKVFGVDATLSYTVQGPVVTKYAIKLAQGTRYTAVTNISDNLMGALQAKSLRIEAPIPGEDHVGVEVPNRSPIGISFREIFESAAWRDFKGELPMLFGRRADGKELIADLATMPHMLVAGATGQGKSVCLNSLINGLLMTRTPEQLKLIMVDPKCVEFTPYCSIPHLLVPVITDNRKVVFSLHWAVAEMEKRLKLFARARVRNIYDFNHRPNLTQTDMFGNDTEVESDIPRTVPYIVIIIDEAADLIGQCGKDVNPDIQRITQKARAAGIHLILATQRPDAKIITGAIKANIPGRVAFKTSSSVDSRTILDETGAENLIGRGDMLFRGKDGLLIRAQGAWISDEEIANVTSFIEKHSDVQFDEKFATKLGRVKEAAIEDPFASNEDDPDNQKPQNSSSSAAAQRAQVKAEANASDFKKAIECIINTNRASTSHFQRKLGWGYNHSATIMEMLESAGIIGPQSGAGPRQIMMDQDQLLAIFNGDGAEDAAMTAPLDNDEAEPVEDGDDNFMEDNTND